ncbi:MULTISPECIES: cyclic peptide export ABC transporter [Nostocales]|uniref:Cyclic peptide export ABC transporter n=4 Tax=Nostocales TaxID=1161 RepID=A0A8S9TH20_9CYAN|nr:cyclic peptide export ABC transporter [Tolypothrix bouteillei]KAF3891328.1 cyclic peptide export ABC transporter [Tolypothrix bouteillei VB521301]
MRLISFLLSSSWKIVTLAIVTGFLSGGSNASLIALISSAASNSANSRLAIAIWGFAGLTLVALITSVISQMLLIRISQNAIFQLRLRLSNQILASELSHLEQLGNPRILATLTEDVQTVAHAVHVMPHLCIDIAIVIGCLTYVTWLSWLVFLMVLGVAVVAIGSCQWLLNQGKKYLSLAREDQDILFKHFRTITEGVKELKLNYKRRQAFLAKDLQPTATTFSSHNIKGLSFYSFTTSWGRLIFFFAIGFVIFSLPNILIINPQTLAGFILTFTYLMLPMNNIVENIPIITRASIALDKIESLGLSLESKAERSIEPPEAQTLWRDLQLLDVTHNYKTHKEDSSFGIGPINLTFVPHQLVFIVGGNGSGKSTLAKIIVGLYTPESGKILFDGKTINEENREWYRQHFSVVFSDFYLFDELLGLDNLALETKSKEYLKLLRLDRKVTIENGKLSTTNLSQGQRKRLALLTAYLEDRPIYLFDEWAADQDPVFKEVFYTELLPRLRDRGKTVIAITHDDRYFHVADRIIKLDYGQIEFDK